MLYILLPAYNEERDIRSLLERICGAMQQLNVPNYKVFVVNDGSTDGTVRQVLAMQAAMPVELLNHGVNKGLGQSMLTGFRYATAQINSEDVLVSMDADNTHEPLLIGAMLEKICPADDVRGADVVIASRYEKGGQEIGLSKIRSILSRVASSLMMIFFPIPGAKDYTCGYRAYSGEILKRAYQVYGDQLVEERGFTCMAEILIKLRAVGARVAEVPLVLRYDLKSGMSKMKVVRTILRYFVLIGKNLKGTTR
jgi:dolichol-phosphate mannosyltransferase